MRKYLCYYKEIFYVQMAAKATRSFIKLHRIYKYKVEYFIGRKLL